MRSDCNYISYTACRNNFFCYNIVNSQEISTSQPSKDEAQTALYKDPVRTAL